jgi:hypothetical protein
MNARDVERRVESIREMAGDPEVAHAEQDALYRDVLVQISKGSGRSAALASAALKVESVKFARWYA